MSASSQPCDPDPTLNKVQFIWCKQFSSLHRLLSLNIVREICRYLGFELTLMPSINSNILRVFDVKSKTKLKVCLSKHFSERAVFCFVDRYAILSVGGAQKSSAAYLISVSSGEVSATQDMRVQRERPGVYPYEGNVYVFGGNMPLERTCEKFNVFRQAWTALPDMSYERFSFSPCYYAGDLLLADTNTSHKVIEAFTLQTETFRSFPVRIHGNEVTILTDNQLRKRVKSRALSDEFCNSVGFVINDELVILGDDGHFWSWKIATEKEMRKGIINRRDTKAENFSLPIVYKGNAYFTNWSNARLLKYNPQNRILEEVLGFTSPT